MASNESPGSQRLLTQNAVTGCHEALYHIISTAEHVTSPSFSGWTLDMGKELRENTVRALAFPSKSRADSAAAAYGSDSYRSGAWYIRTPS